MSRHKNAWKHDLAYFLKDPEKAREERREATARWRARKKAEGTLVHTHERIDKRRAREDEQEFRWRNNFYLKRFLGFVAGESLRDCGLDLISYDEFENPRFTFLYRGRRHIEQFLEPLPKF
jgi:hypothetical protein